MSNSTLKLENSDEFSRRKVLIVMGTRPECIKLAPLIHELRRYGDAVQPIVCSTGQHVDLLSQTLRVFDLQPDINLDLAAPSQTPIEVVHRVALALEPLLQSYQPLLVVVQGDTATAYAAAYAAFHARIEIAHVEAGLRSYNPDAPWPEELFRRLIAVIAKYHFAPTRRAADNLRRENIDPSGIYITGNTGIDALQWAISEKLTLPDPKDRWNRVLVTTHRRETLGEGTIRIFRAIYELAKRYPRIEFFCPVHPNPTVAEGIHRAVGRDIPSNIRLEVPMNYLSLIELLLRCDFVITDSGGLQEEGPSLGKPVLVLREETERSEGVEAGIARLVGADTDLIVSAATELIEDVEVFRRMTGGEMLYGDGRAAERISETIAEIIGVVPLKSQGVG